MRQSVRLSVVVLALFSLVGCGGGGPMLVEPTVTHSDVSSARQALATHRLEPSRDMERSEMWEAMRSIWYDLLDPVTQTCNTLFTGCYEAVMNIKVELVDDQSVNAYADAESYAIGIHTGLMRSAGSDDEIAWVLAHEAAHLLLGHAQKKMSNAATGGLLGGIAMGALGVAIHQPGMDTEYIGDMTQGGLESGRLAGYLVYSPEMELEADQFAAYVMQRAGYRTNAALDIIVRLHRGEVPASVRRGENWAGYLDTHPANDYRLAAMQSTINDIERGGTRPISKQEAEQERWQKFSNASEVQDELNMRIATTTYAPRLASNDECTGLAQEHPKCDWWQGEGDDWMWVFHCPTPIKVGIDLWNRCFPHEQEDWNTLIDQESQTERCKTWIREYPDCKWWDGEGDLWGNIVGRCPLKGGWPLCRRLGSGSTIASE